MALGVPPDLAEQHPHIFVSDLPSRHARKTHMLSVVQLIPLQEIFVQALSSTAYSKAKADISSSEGWLCRGQKILRQDSVYTLDTQDSPDRGALKYKVIMTEPVLQGYAGNHKRRLLCSRPQRTHMPFTGTRTAYCYRLPFRKTFKLQTMKVSRLARAFWPVPSFLSRLHSPRRTIPRLSVCQVLPTRS